MFGKNQEIEELRTSIGDLQQSRESVLEELKRLKKQVQALQEKFAACEKEKEEEAALGAPDSEPEAGMLTSFTPEPSHAQPRAQVFFLAAPTVDGLFLRQSTTEQIGKSIYKLVSMDGVNGNFILLDTPDAIATAMISVSQFVKSVCKVNGNIASMPRHIITEEEGVATREGEGWRVVRKAVVRFE
ncbi:hypothetical protein [Prevotella sp. KH2C16]|uniref:hypothetical protein n=1 Tax=Prevotella sp. KH2C16 TaxID=1855325 RepID=UPI0008EF83DE|nr:hypothetical protein [Prevotella sp. KH2C16]SFG21696.1 hypothetical protein SAMN05216383_10767 [Prevotella sp. KH2C16]